MLEACLLKLKAEGFLRRGTSEEFRCFPIGIWGTFRLHGENLIRIIVLGENGLEIRNIFGIKPHKLNCILA